jgi:hypothetical protein
MLKKQEIMQGRLRATNIGFSGLAGTELAS